MNFSQSAIFSIIASFGLLFVNLFISIIESRVLGPEEIGRFQVYITTQTYIATICALGIGQSCIYFINALKITERKVLSTSVNASLVLALLSGIAILLIIVLNPNYFGSTAITSICMFSIGTSAVIINNIFTPVLLARMEVVRNQVIKYSSRVITLIVLLFIVLRGNNLSVDFLIGLTGVTSVLSTFLLYYYFRNRFSFNDGIDYRLLWEITSYGIKLSGNNIASITLISLPIYFLTWFSTTDGVMNVGYYGRANSLLVIGTIISTSIGPLLYSKWSGTSKDELKSQVRRMSMMYFLINLVITLGLIAFAPLLIKILYGQEFLPSIRILQVLAVSIVGNGIKEICYGILSSQGHPTKILKNLILGIVACAIGDYWMISYYGVLGCSIVTSIVSIFTAVLLMIDTTKISNIKILDFFVLPSKQDIRSIVQQVLRKS